MEVRGPGNIGGVNPVGRVDLTPSSRGAEGTPKVAGKDTVEISQLARLLDSMSRLPEVRHDKVSAVKAQIESGVYETSDKLDRAIDAMLKEL